ncbi:MAG: hypothetical protein ACI9LM_002622 [Alteromonadaceae bacterium]|jgi:hypothetical protein
MRINTVTKLFLISFILLLSGCVVVSTAVGVTTSVVGGVIEVVDTVTPDILDDEQDEGSKEKN